MPGRAMQQMTSFQPGLRSVWSNNNGSDRMNGDRMDRMVNRMTGARETSPPGAPILFTILSILSPFILSKPLLLLLLSSFPDFAKRAQPVMQVGHSPGGAGDEGEELDTTSRSPRTRAG